MSWHEGLSPTQGSQRHVELRTDIMSRRTSIVTTLILAVYLLGCDAPGPVEDPTGVMLRVENAGEIDFSSVLISFPGAEAEFGTLPAGATSEYKGFAVAYHYGFVEVMAEGETYRLQPIDYVGEEPLPNGHYTYTLRVEGDQLLFEFDRD